MTSQSDRTVGLPAASMRSRSWVPTGIAPRIAAAVNGVGRVSSGAEGSSTGAGGSGAGECGSPQPAETRSAAVKSQVYPRIYSHSWPAGTQWSRTRVWMSSAAETVTKWVVAQIASHAPQPVDQ